MHDGFFQVVRIRHEVLLYFLRVVDLLYTTRQKGLRMYA